MPTTLAGLPERYVRVQRIATGGMGEIYVADDETLGRRVAIKVLADRFAVDGSIRQRFTQEALAAARLSGNQHIVTIFDVGEAEGRPFIVMEYLPGGTVGDRAVRGPIPHDQALAWLRDTAAALDEAHANGIVHRDVKPANLLLDDRDHVHVADFGIARVADTATSGMTLTGTVLGTAGYLSPEQARGEPATAESDVYGLGIVAYELLTGGRPFEGDSATAEASAHIHEPVPPASERGVGLSRDVDDVFERALAKDPRDRYRTAGDFVDALAVALAGRQTEPTRVLAPPVPVERTEPRRRSRAWIPLLLLLAAAGIGAALLAAAVTGNDDTTPTQPKAKRITITQTTQGQTVRQTVTVQPPPPTPPPTPTPTPAVGSIGEARALTDDATRALRAGQYAQAASLAERALTRLRGSGDIYEAYAYYDAGAAYAALGQCDKALDYLDRSEAIQGKRKEIDRARKACGG
jgi:eukaryotic-like serine/threonine-protein kinase